MADTTPTPPFTGNKSDLSNLGNLPSPSAPARNASQSDAGGPITPIPSPSPDTRLNLIAEPTNNPVSQHPKKLLYLGSSIILVVSVFLLSFFFFRNQRQPKPNSHAAEPSPVSQPTTGNVQPTTSSRSGFSSLLGGKKEEASPTPSPADSRPADTPPRVNFDITAANDTFTPNQITVYQNQIVVISVGAVDKTYDFTIPELSLSKVFKQGQKSILEFQATTTGLFTFKCIQYCSGTSAQGLLIVKP